MLCSSSSKMVSTGQPLPPTDCETRTGCTVQLLKLSEQDINCGVGHQNCKYRHTGGEWSVFFHGFPLIRAQHSLNSRSEYWYRERN